MSGGITRAEEARLLGQLRDDGRAGREAAFRRIFELYREGVFAVCFSLTGNRHDAEDAAQEVFLGVHQGLDRFRGEARLKTWIYRIALRQAGRIRQRRLRQAETAERMEPPAEQCQAQDAAVSADRLARALDALPRGQRAVLVLHAMQGMSHAEIAEVLGIKEGTVWSRLHTARKKVEAFLVS